MNTRLTDLIPLITFQEVRNQQTHSNHDLRRLEDNKIVQNVCAKKSQTLTVFETHFGRLCPTEAPNLFKPYVSGDLEAPKSCS